LVPRTFVSLVWTYVLLNIFLVLTSTVLGGLMVDVGQRFHATGRVSAQRVGINRSVSLISGPIGGFLASRPFMLTMTLSAALHFALVPLFGRWLREERGAWTPPSERLAEVWQQFRTLFRS